MFLKTVQQAKRFFRILAGFTVLVAGILMLVTPGPGWAAIFGGLAILAGEFVWAERVLNRLKHHGGKIRDAVFSSKKNNTPETGPKEAPPAKP